jgi:glutaredoxin
MSFKMKARVIIYSRPGCHLCDEVKEAIRAANCASEYDLEEINIETDEQLLEKFRYGIPVIAVSGVEAFRHRLDADEFRERISACAAETKAKKTTGDSPKAPDSIRD